MSNIASLSLNITYPNAIWTKNNISTLPNNITKSPKPFLGYVGGATSLVPYLFFEGISNLFIKNNFLHMK